MFVELSHSHNKYWIAEVVGDFGGLLSLKWFSKNVPCKDFFHDLNDRRLPVFYPLGFYEQHKEDFPGMTREAPSVVSNAEQMKICKSF
jgi:hypothetical protein